MPEKLQRNQYIIGFNTFVILILLLVFPSALEAKSIPNKLMLVKGKRFELCRDFLAVANAPENAALRSSQGEGQTLTIPKRFKKFRQVRWHPLETLEGLAMLDEETLQHMKKVRKECLAGSCYQGNKSQTGPWIIEQATVMFDIKAGKQPMVRFRMHGWEGWDCAFPKQANVGKRYVFDGCQWFSYKERYFVNIGPSLDIYQVNQSLISVPDPGTCLPLGDGKSCAATSYTTYTVEPRVTWNESICIFRFIGE